MLRDKDWYIEQYNRNREYSDWVFSYEEIEENGGQMIHFGAKGYGHNYSAAARKSFRARHKCSTAKSKLTARYWACKNLWAGKGGSTKSSPKSRRGKY